MIQATLFEHTSVTGRTYYTVGLVRDTEVLTKRFLLRSWLTKRTAVRKCAALQRELDAQLVKPVQKEQK